MPRLRRAGAARPCLASSPPPPGGPAASMGARRGRGGGNGAPAILLISSVPTGPWAPQAWRFTAIAALLLLLPSVAGLCTSPPGRPGVEGSAGCPPAEPMRAEGARVG